ncbi:hypothetical protein PMAYCL1PPCAC_11480, partial [Pristionchus mayeri]
MFYPSSSHNVDSAALESESLNSDHVIDPEMESEKRLMSEIREKAEKRLAEIGVTGVNGEAVAEIICSLIKEHLRKVETERNTDRTLAFPDEIVMTIFSKMTTEERAPLGLTCKRFRELNF